MTARDTAFAGSIPALYDEYLGPLLFEPYAEEVARRAREFGPGHLLETAAGTGLVTAALQGALPDTEIIATDLNPAMLEIAEARVGSSKVNFEAADAQDLRFVGESFDLVVCQFGVMFYPDKVRGNAEARRVLRDGGRYLLVVWDRLERNPASKIVHEAVARTFPADPPGFLARTPFGYADPVSIEQDLRAAGFSDIDLETVSLKSRPTSPRQAAVGLVCGSPLRAEIEQHGPSAITLATEAAAAALEELQSDEGFDSTLSAHIVTATR